MKWWRIICMADKKKGKELRMDNLVKIPYFDEEAAQDYLDMCNGGHLDWSTDENKERLGKIIGEIEAEVGGGINVLAMLKAAFQGKGDMGYSSIVSKVVDSKLQNTLLTDYLARANGDDNVYKFESVTVAPYPNSFTMYKMFSSYLTIVPKEQMPIDMEKLNQAILGERGYYEMIVDDGNEKSILRFNINAFRNNYNLADFLKMKLTYYGVPVGTLNLENLKIENEFNYINKPEKISAEMVLGDTVEETVEKCIVYDVIIAGVSHE